MKRALTIGAVAALVIGVTLPAAAFEPNLDVSVAYADAALPGDPLSPQSLDVAEGAVSASVKDAFSAEAAPVVEVATTSSGGGGYASTSYSGPLPDGFGGIVMWPVNAPVNDGFGYRDGGEFHGGIDIMCGYGAAIVAAADGVVTQTGWWGGYGNVVVINHGAGVETYYSHLSGIAIETGTWVSAGTLVGFSGDTGYATVAHLHFELHLDGGKIDPMPYMP